MSNKDLLIVFHCKSFSLIFLCFVYLLEIGLDNSDVLITCFAHQVQFKNLNQLDFMPISKTNILQNGQFWQIKKYGKSTCIALVIIGQRD